MLPTEVHKYLRSEEPRDPCLANKKMRRAPEEGPQAPGPAKLHIPAPYGPIEGKLYAGMFLARQE